MFAPVGFLPYLRIGVSPRVSCAIDSIVSGARLLNFMFVNQCIVLRKPE